MRRRGFLGRVPVSPQGLGFRVQGTIVNPKPTPPIIHPKYIITI